MNKQIFRISSLAVMLAIILVLGACAPTPDEDQTGFLVTFSVEGGSGTLTAAVGATAITSGSRVQAARRVDFTASPAEGYRIREWTRNGTPTDLASSVDETYDEVLWVTLSGPLARDLTVTVEFEAIPPAAGIAIAGSANIGIAEGAARNLQVIFYPAGAKWPDENHRVIWTSDNLLIARITAIDRGLTASLEGLGGGTTRITAQLLDGNDSPVGLPVTFNITVEGDISGDFIDPIFQGIVRDMIGVPTGPFAPAELAWIVALDLDNRGITSLAGIQNFANLTTLYAPSNSLESVDVSMLQNLEALNLSNNDLESLDLTSNPALRKLNITTNRRLADLDLSNNPKLVNINAGQLGISVLDLSANPNIEVVTANGNGNLTNVIWPATRSRLLSVSITGSELNPSALASFTLTDAPDLNFVWIFGNNISALDLSNNPSLLNIRAHNNNLSCTGNINLTGNSSLVSFDLANNQFASFDGSFLPRSVRELTLGGNNLNSINLTQNPGLETISVHHNDLASLDLSKNVNLMRLSAEHNQLSGFMDFTNNPHLYFLNLANNNLTGLDITGTSLGKGTSDIVFFLGSLDLTNNNLPNLNAVKGWRELPLYPGANFHVFPPPSANTPTPVITTTTILDARAGEQFSFFFEADNSYSHIRWLPDWPAHVPTLNLELQPNRGELRGIPAPQDVGTFTFGIKAVYNFRWDDDDEFIIIDYVRREFTLSVLP